MVNMKVVKKINRAYVKEAQQGYLNGLEATLIALEAQCKAFAPVDTGLLRISIRHKIKRTQGVVYTNASYAEAQEEGTPKMEAANNGEGYFKPAADIIRNKIDRIFGKAFEMSFRR